MKKSRTMGTKQVILATLVNSKSEWVTYDHLFHEIWGHDPNGGPDDPMRIFKVQLCVLRKMLRGHGVEIRTRFGESLQIPLDQRARAIEIMQELGVFHWKRCPECGGRVIAGRGAGVPAQ